MGGGVSFPLLNYCSVCLVSTLHHYSAGGHLCVCVCVCVSMCVWGGYTFYYFLWNSTK